MLTEKETLQRAKMYLEKLCEGIDPLTGRAVDASTLQNERIRKCFTYICKVLNKQITVADLPPKSVEKWTERRRRKKPFYITEEERRKIRLPQGACLVSVLVDIINEAVNDNERKRLTGKAVTTWLAAQGYLCEQMNEQGRIYWWLTEQANSIGLFESVGIGAYGA